MQQGLTNHSDMGHGLFLNSTCDIGENKRQGHVTLPFRARSHTRVTDYDEACKMHLTPGVVHSSPKDVGV